MYILDQLLVGGQRSRGSCLLMSRQQETSIAVVAIVSKWKTAIAETVTGSNAGGKQPVAYVTEAAVEHHGPRACSRLSEQSIFNGQNTTASEIQRTTLLFLHPGD